MLQKLRDKWNGLPHQMQAAIVAFLVAAGASLVHAAEDAGLKGCSTWGCVGKTLALVFSPHMVFTAVFAGAAALKVFYTLPNGTAKLIEQAQAAQPTNPGQPQK